MDYSSVLEHTKSREGLLEALYYCLESGNSLDSIHIPHSDVFFVREALEDRFGCELSLEQVEEYMKEAGWTDGVSTRTSEEQDEGAGSFGCEQTEEDPFS
jgi:hypothetical protein